MNIINKKVVLKNRPKGFPKLDDFEIVTEEIPSLNYGEVLVKILWLSLDPYMRGRMSEAKSYAPPIKIGEVITGGAVGKIIASKCPNIAEGRHCRRVYVRLARICYNKILVSKKNRSHNCSHSNRCRSFRHAWNDCILWII